MVHDKTASDDEGSGDEAGGWGLLSSMAQSSKGKVAPEPEPQPRVKNEGSALAKAQAKLGTVTAQMRVALFSIRRALKWAKAHDTDPKAAVLIGKLQAAPAEIDGYIQAADDKLAEVEEGWSWMYDSLSDLRCATFDIFRLRLNLGIRT